MPATASGWQYANSTDTLVSWPAVSQAVADQLETQIGATNISTGVDSITLISTTALSGATVSITSIPQTYKDLRLVIRNFRPATDGNNCRLRLNQDSTASRHEQSGSSDAVSSFSATFINLAVNVDNGAQSGLIIATIYDYANTATWSLVDVISTSNNSATSTNVNFYSQRGVYNQTSAITSFDLLSNSGNITSGTLLLYGVK